MNDLLAPILFYDDSDIANLVSFDYTCNNFDTRTVFSFVKLNFQGKISGQMKCNNILSIV